MARASTPTWLSLDRWAQIMGIHPLHFNQLYHTTLAAVGSACGDVWFQYEWHDANRIGREGLAEAIAEAEGMLANYVGYNLRPDWIADERVLAGRPKRPELLFGNITNPRGLFMSVTAQRGHLISGGVRAKTVIGAAQAVPAATDEDGDGYDETHTLTVPTTVTDPCEVGLFYPGEAGADEWEIRPINVSIAGGIATIVFKRWQIVDPNEMEKFGAAALNAVTAANFLATVDVYRVFNDPQTQATLMWEADPSGSCSCGEPTCAVCAFSTQAACLGVRDPRLGILTYRPATWDADDQAFVDADLVVCRAPERVRLWYYSGWKDPHPRNGCPETSLDPFWERVIARLAAGLLDRPLCSCNNVERFVDHWREDMAVVTGEHRFKATTDAQISNPFGSTRGAIYAWKQCNLDGRRIGQ